MLNDELPTLNDKELIHWLWAKYRRHGEIEDGAAAERLTKYSKWFDDHASVLASHNIGGFSFVTPDSVSEGQ